jgi:8-oxo-dGTP pyrophosphatase MutT (NUDIX family)
MAKKDKKKKKKRRMTGEAVIFNKAGRVLLVRQSRERGHNWELPGGKVKKTEALPDAIIREVREETGIDVVPHRLLGIFYVRQKNIYDFVVECRLADEALVPKANPPEIVDCKFFKVDKLPRQIRGFTLDRIADAREGTIYPLPVEIGKDEWV